MLAEDVLDELPETTDEVPLPDEGTTQLVTVAESGLRAARAPEEELGCLVDEGSG